MKAYLNLVESESTLADVVAGHERVIDDNSRLKEKVEITVGILIYILLITLLSWHLAANGILAEVELSVVSDKF